MLAAIQIRVFELLEFLSGLLELGFLQRPAGAFGGYGGPRIIDLSADLSDGLSADLVAEAPAALPGDGLVLTR